MQDLITSFLVQTHECSLPRIGRIRIVNVPAKMDTIHKKMSPPGEQIIFTQKDENNARGLPKYIANKKNITEAEAGEQLDAWCLATLAKLEHGEKITFKSVGSLGKKEPGSIYFEREQSVPFFESLAAERVIHENADHAVLVGDKETTSSAMNQYLKEEEEVKRSGWKIAAAVLLVIALAILFIHFFSGSSSSFSTGNETRHVPATPAPTHF